MNLRPLDPQSSTLNQAELRPDRIEFRHDADASAGHRWAVVCFAARAISGGRAIIPRGRSAPQRRKARGVAEDIARTAKPTPGKRSTTSAPAAPRRSTQTKLPSRSFLRSDAARRRTQRPTASACVHQANPLANPAQAPQASRRADRRRGFGGPIGNVVRGCRSGRSRRIPRCLSHEYSESFPNTEDRTPSASGDGCTFSCPSAAPLVLLSAAARAGFVATDLSAGSHGR